MIYPLRVNLETGLEADRSTVIAFDSEERVVVEVEGDFLIHKVTMRPASDREAALALAISGAFNLYPDAELVKAFAHEGGLL